MPTSPFAARHLTRRAVLVAVVTAALLCAQWLGLVHRVVHDGVHLGEHRLGALFDGHGAKGADCHLFDQLMHADALGTAPCALPVVPLRTTMPLVHAAWQLAAQAVGALARGPPARA